MAAFTQDAQQATKAQDPGEQEKMQRMLEQRAATATKQYGGVGAAPVTQAPQTDLKQSLEAQDAFSSADYARRAKAAPVNYALAQTRDTQGQALQSQVRDALRGRSDLAQDVATTQRQQDDKYAVDTATINQQYQTQLASQNFTHFKNVGDQADAMFDAYSKGQLGFQMIDLANKNMLNLADIEKYFSIIRNDISNDIKDIQVRGDYAIKTLMDKANQTGQNISAIFSGLSSLTALGAKGYGDYKTKTGYFTPAPSETP